MHKIKDVFDFQMGCYEPRFEKGKDEVELLKSSNFNNEDIKVIKTVYDENSKYIVTGNEILMRQTGNIEFYIHEKQVPTYFDSTIIKLIPKKNINIYYLLYKLNDPKFKKTVAINISGTMIGKIKLSDFENIEIDLRDIDKHEIIGNIYKLKMKRINLLKRKLVLEEMILGYI